jgi:hypothetical protein
LIDEILFEPNVSCEHVSNEPIGRRVPLVHESHHVIRVDDEMVQIAHITR